MSLPENMQVLLIGGSSGMGKTLLARALSQQWGIPALQVDDFCLVLWRMIEKAQQRSSAGTDLWDPLGLRPIFSVVEQFTGTLADPESMAEGLASVGAVMSDAIEIVIAHHVATRTQVIIEGDGLLPSLDASSPIDNLIAVPGELRAVFLIEDQEDRLFSAALRRGRGAEQGSPADQRRVIRASWLYGQWLKTEALGFLQPILTPHPWETLVDRTMQVLKFQA